MVRKRVDAYTLLYLGSVHVTGMVKGCVDGRNNWTVAETLHLCTLLATAPQLMPSSSSADWQPSMSIQYGCCQKKSDDVLRFALHHGRQSERACSESKGNKKDTRIFIVRFRISLI
jgi:hypothetical protein